MAFRALPRELRVREKGIHVCFVVEGQDGRSPRDPPSVAPPLSSSSSDLTGTNASLALLSMAIKTSIMYHVTASGKITLEGRGE